MSESIPSTSHDKPKRRIRRKYELKLPTPPPDPNEDILEYVENLQKRANESKTAFTSAMVAEDAFDHLEKLYKVMEQMLELRAQNNKLQRKIRDLEYLNNLEKMYKQVEELENEECPDLDKDTAFAETILESILTDGKTKPRTFSKQSILRKQRNRSSSTVESPNSNKEPFDRRRSSVYYPSSSKNSKISKWTKVKAAFKWEKTSPIDAKSMDSGISGVQPVEVARYLRVPSTSDDFLGHSPTDSGAAEISTPGTLSTASSNDDFQKNDRLTGHRNPCEGFRSSDDEAHCPHNKEDSKKSPSLSQRSTKLPWSKVKNIIPSRTSFKKKTRLSTHSDEVQIDVELCSDNEDVFEEENKSSGTQPTTPCSFGKSDSDNDGCNVEKSQNVETTENEKNFDQRKFSKWMIVKKAFLPTLDIEKANQEIKVTEEKTTPESRKIIKFEIDRNYRKLQNKLSMEFQENHHFSPTQTPIPDEIQTFRNDKIFSSTKQKSLPTSQDLPPEFKKKLQEWEKIKKSSVRSSKRSPETPRWKLLQSQTSVEIPTITDEFRKKLEEWKHIKAEKHQQEEKCDKKGNKTPSPGMVKKAEGKKEDKEIQWYEKELSKIEKEKERLERERQKFLEREERLTKLRKSVTGTDKKDIFVHTPEGFYKFEGISRKFTQKLYEWEKSQGISPESSTFAYLTSEYKPKKSSGNSKNFETTQPLTRSKSVDSIHVSSTLNECSLKSQPSSMSLSNMDKLEEECMLPSSSIEFDISENAENQPEAIIVEVNDFVEETATPLNNTFTEHIPVYQREELRTLGTCFPTNIHRKDSTKAQLNYYLIESIFILLQNLSKNDREFTNFSNTPDEITQLQMDQKSIFKQLYNKLLNLQKENLTVVTDLNKEYKKQPGSRLSEVMDIVQDLSYEILSMAEKLEEALDGKLQQNTIVDNATVGEYIFSIKNKLYELRRHLSYVCAVSDSTAPKRCDKSAEQNPRLYTKSGNTQSQGAIKKRLRYQQRCNRKKSFEDTDDEENIENKGSLKNACEKEKNTLTLPSSSVTTPNDDSPLDSPVTVFVKTTRRLFTPLVEVEMKLNPEESVTVKNSEDDFIILENSKSNKEPIPLSPIPQRKILKDISPSIKIMLDKYNEKITLDVTNKGGSGSNSPVAWRSPIAEKRVKAQTEKYQEEIQKLSPLFPKREIKKSVSLAFISNRQKFTCPPQNENAVQKSISSTTFPPLKMEKTKELISNVSNSTEMRHSLKVRQEKLRKAKEEFLNTPSTGKTSQNDLNYPSRNRLSQISMGSSSSVGSSTTSGILTKSISVGMIQIDSESYKNIESDGRCCLSLPRTSKPPTSKSTLSNIAEKFRKVKMRRGKTKGSTVSALCRQSLMVDINQQERSQNSDLVTQSSPSLSAKSKSSWLRKANFFKK